MKRRCTRSQYFIVVVVDLLVVVVAFSVNTFCAFCSPFCNVLNNSFSIAKNKSESESTTPTATATATPTATATATATTTTTAIATATMLCTVCTTRALETATEALTHRSKCNWRRVAGNTRPLHMHFLFSFTFSLFLYVLFYFLRFFVFGAFDLRSRMSSARANYKKLL